MTDLPRELLAEAPRVLIVRPTALGDVSRTVPALVTLRRACPGARIDWLVAEAFADVVRHHPMLDGVVTFARDRLARFGRRPAATREGLALRRRLREPGYDAVYDLQGLFRSGLFAWLTGAPRRVGFADAREGGWLGYNVRHRLDAGLVHTVDRMLGLLEAEGLEAVRDLQLYVGADDRRWLGEWCAERGVGAEGYACLAPTARWGCKCWPIERYTEVARRLLATGLAGGGLVVLASPSERGQVQPLLDALTPAERERVWFPRTTVGQMMALVSEARLLVCNDSAPLHIAVGLGRPIVAVFGPTNPAEVGPYGRAETVVQPAGAGAGMQKFNYRQHRDDQTLIARVDVETVWAKVREQVAGGR